MTLTIIDKHFQTVPFVGFVLIRKDITDVRKGSVYPYGIDPEGHVLILDDANELQTVGPDFYLIYEDGARYITLQKPFAAHNLHSGSISRAHDHLIGRDINSGCVWVKSFSPQHDYFATNKSNVRDFNRPLWTAQAYRYRMQSAQVQSQVVTVTPPSFIGVGSDKINTGIPPFTPEERVTRIVTVEFTPGGKQYTYLLPNHLTAVKGDDAVVVVNNPNYPELKGTKVVRITGVYTRNSLDHYDNYKSIEHVVSKSAERRKELEQKINDKRIQLRQAEKRIETMANQLTKLEEDLVNGKY